MKLHATNIATWPFAILPLSSIAETVHVNRPVFLEANQDRKTRSGIDRPTWGDETVWSCYYSFLKLSTGLATAAFTD